MTAQAEKIAGKASSEKGGTGNDKAAEHAAHKPVLEKRRALGRGLESLLPGPRAVPTPAPAASATPATTSFGTPIPVANAQEPVAAGQLADTGAESTVANPLSSGVVNAATGSEEDVSVADAEGTAGNQEQAAEVRAAAGDSQLEHPSAQMGQASDETVGSPEETGGVEEGLRQGEVAGDDEAAVPGTVDSLQAAGESRAATRSLPVMEIPIDLIDKNPHQTRSKFEAEALGELATSILAQGVIQPIVVRPGKEGRYILILGERRLRASKVAGKTTIPAVVRRVSEQHAAEMTLVENLQRQDLNCIDQAHAFRRLSMKFQMTQEEIGTRVGVSRQTVANYMRLLRLPGPTSVYLQNEQLTYSHARELLAIEDDETLEKMAMRAVKEKMSVDQLEEEIVKFKFDRDCVDEYAGLRGPRRGARWVDPNVRAQQRSLESILGMKVRIRDRRGKGTIRIEYTSLEDFDRVVTMLKGKKAGPVTQ